ncbi:MAG: ABC transporter ATP-binding protein, partial [Ruminococcaceae bacterium]|nr:ABC transporter ATP-binding protein [Oscillospiraceae bacterium]
MIKHLLKCIREYRTHTILSPLLVTMEVVMEVIIPLLMASLIDDGIDKGDMNYIILMGGILAVCCVISLAFGALSGRSAAIASCGFAKNLRQDMFYHVQDYSFANIDRFSPAGIVTRLTTDVTNVQMAFQMIIRVAVRSPIMLIFSMVMSFTISTKLALIFLALAPVLGLGLWLIMGSAHPIFERVFKTYDRLNQVVSENLRGIRVVKSFVRQDHEIDKFKDVSGSIYRDFLKAERILAFNGPFMQICSYVGMLLLAWFGARIIVSTGATELTTGNLISLITYAMQILMSLMMVAMIFVMITISRASAERICEVLDEKSTLHNGENPILKVTDGSICFEGVGFSYAGKDGTECLSGIDLEIPSGQTVGIIGGTGSSKTTLVQLIPRLYDVTAGRLLVGGVDVRDYDLETLRNEVAMVLQKNVLFSGTIKENLRWGNETATDEEMIHACKLAAADEFISTFPDGYDTVIDQGGTNVSGGQKQRLCIARALLKKPKILILDDSTSAVDTKTDAMIRRAFREEIP